MKYLATARRINLHPKPDYLWIARTNDGNPLEFDTELAAFEYPQSFCNDPAHSMHSPRATPVNDEVKL